MVKKATQFEPWQIVSFGLGGMVLLTILAYSLGVRPMLARHSKMMQDRQTLATQRARAEDLHRREMTLTFERERKNRELSKSSLTLRSTDHRNQRLALLTDLAAANGLTVDGIQSRDVEQADFYDMVPIQLNGVGHFPNCSRLLAALNREFPDMGVRSFNLQGQPGPKPNDLKFTVDMIWYAAPSSVTMAE